MTDSIKDDLDAFLTALESKLKAPFSSVDLAKTMDIAAMRGTMTHVEYLQRVAGTIDRASEKAIRLRILLGLLNVDVQQDGKTSNDDRVELDHWMQQILTQTQVAPTHEEWVRVLSGLVQGAMYTDANGEAPARGDEAAQLLDKTCTGIVEHVRQLEHDTNIDAASPPPPHYLTTAHADPRFVPYRYSLLNADLRQRLLPELDEQQHFVVNYDDELLHMDANHERDKAQEEQEHAVQAGVKSITTTKPSNGGGKVAAIANATPVFPGFQPGGSGSNASKRPGAAARGGGKSGTSSSMFMPKKPGFSQRPPAIKAGLHVRKAGASQALVGKGRQRLAGSLAGGTSAGGASGRGAGITKDAGTGIRGRVLHGSSAGASKLKILDSAETPPAKGNEATFKGSTTVSLKRKQPEPEQPSRTTDDDKEETSLKVIKKDAPPNTATDLVTGALAAYQARANANDDDPNVPQEAPPLTQPQPPPTPAAAHKQQDWQSMLQSKSNRLSADDRLRIEQFFVHRYNPTPEQPTVKIKLHEERGTDGAGIPVKETFYLDLDYTTFTSKQYKKTKKYKDAG